MFTDKALERAWNTLLELGTSEETLRIITDINGLSVETLEDVLYAAHGYHHFDQL